MPETGPTLRIGGSQLAAMLELVRGKPETGSVRRGAPESDPVQPMTSTASPTATSRRSTTNASGPVWIGWTRPPAPKETGGTPLSMVIEGLTRSAPWMPVAAYGGAVSLTPRSSPICQVAACSQVGVDYTRRGPRSSCRTVAACSQVGVDYTPTDVVVSCSMLRLARRLGSITLYERILEARERLRLARRLGSITLLGWTACGTASCGLLAGWGRLHSRPAIGSSTQRCGLLAGWGRLH